MVNWEMRLMVNTEEHCSFLKVVDHIRCVIEMGFEQMVQTVFDREFYVHCRDFASENEMIRVIA